ncbi:MAG: hypothetical protein ACI9ZT_002236, partial [Gammaproteobacteria bacterium]
TVIYGYVLKNNYLPCPDCIDNDAGCAAATANDGQEDRTAGVCDVLDGTDVVGNLPWVTLGVNGTDEWNNIFTYQVDSEYADTIDGTPLQTDCIGLSVTLNVSFSLCSIGDIAVLDSAGGATVATEIPAIIVSHGKNSSDNAPSADELENTDANGTYVDKVYSSAAGTEFDDMLLWISPHVLRTMSVNGGILP